ncbi:MAG: hypothetical protein K6G65_04885 [Lachnospiraceae bacterium]|nr:hypothetical protein [Lachnospiraceae bacterium]
MQKEMDLWIENAFKNNIPTDVVAICFNLYEDGDNHWSMEMVGTANFDLEDSDWACDEVTDFGTRDNPFSWEEESDWESVLSRVVASVSKCIDEGRCDNQIRDLKGIAVGFTDGDLEIVLQSS